MNPLARGPAALPSLPTFGSSWPLGRGDCAGHSIGPDPRTCEPASADWTIADFEPLEGAASGVRASARLRGDSPLGPALTQAQREVLRSQADEARDMLHHYAAARHAARLPGDAAWVGSMAGSAPSVFLTHPDEHAALAGSIFPPGQAADERTSRFAPVPHREGALVCPERFFRAGTTQPTHAALADLQAGLLHPDCREMLGIASRLLRPPVRVHELQQALHRHLMGDTAAAAPARMGALTDAILRGDRAGVVRALVPAEVPAAIDRLSVMPEDAGAREELLALAGDLLASTPPALEKSRQLATLLGSRAIHTLREAVLQGNAAALARVANAYALLHANGSVRTLLQPLIGDFDAVQDMDLTVSHHADKPLMMSRLLADTGLRVRPGPMSVSRQDPVSHLAGSLTAESMALEPDAPAEVPATPEPATQQGTLTRRELAAERGPEPLRLYLVTADGIEYEGMLRYLITPYMGAFFQGAAQGMAQALGLDEAAQGSFVPRMLTDYVSAQLLGDTVAPEVADGARTVRRAIEARARLEGVDFAQAERDLLGVAFRERSFGRPEDFRDLRRLTLCLYEQHRLDVLSQLLQGPTAGEPTLVHAVGHRTTGAGSARVSVVGREGVDWRVKPESADAVPPQGAQVEADGHWRVPPHRLISVVVDQPAQARQAALSQVPGNR